MNDLMYCKRGHFHWYLSLDGDCPNHPGERCSRPETTPHCSEHEWFRKDCALCYALMDAAGAHASRNHWKHECEEADALREETQEVLNNLIARVKEDRREPDKILCHLASANHFLTRHSPI